MSFSQESYNINELFRLDKEKKNKEFKDKINLIAKDTASFSEFNKAKIYFLLGKLNKKEEHFSLAFQNLKRAEELFKKLNNADWLADTHYLIFIILMPQKEFKNQAEEYLDKYYKYVLKKNDKKRLIIAFFGYANINVRNEKYEDAKIYYLKALNISKKIKDINSIGRLNANLGMLHATYFKKQDSARYYYKKASDIYHKLKNDRIEFAITQNIAVSYKNENKLDSAIKWFKKADKIVLKKNLKNNKQILYENLSKVYKQKKDYKNAYDYIVKSSMYKDSINEDKQILAISDIHAKYRTAEKEKENLILKAQKRKQLFIIYASLTGLFLSVLLGFLAYKDLKIKREITEKNQKIEYQKVISLVKDQEILAMDAMIEGQEIERKRIAEELHDNLGSTLATLKMHFDTYKMQILEEDKKQLKVLERTEGILVEAYNKVRTMAHTNYASVLEDNDLIESLQSLVNKISDAKQTKVDFVHFGFDVPMPNTLELLIFRITQELLTNVIKHANASQVSVDLNLFDEQISLIIEDNGVGFDFFKLNLNSDSKMGLSSVKSRVEKENGIFYVDSRIGGGTTIIIEMPLKPEI